MNSAAVSNKVVKSVFRKTLSRVTQLKANAEVAAQLAQPGPGEKVTTKQVYQAAVTAFVMTMSSPAFCQLENATDKIDEISAWLAGLGIAVFTVCIMIVGYKMAFTDAQFRDVWKILAGGFLVGGAAGLAAVVAG